VQLNRIVQPHTQGYKQDWGADAILRTGVAYLKLCNLLEIYSATSLPRCIDIQKDPGGSPAMESHISSWGK